MIEKKQSSGNFLSVLMLLIILGILVTLGYYIFFEPEVLGFTNIEPGSKKVLINGKATEIKSVASPKMSVRLYFSTPTFEALTAEDQEIPKCSSVQECARAVVEKLVKGPGNKDNYRTIPPMTTLRTVFLNGETLVVDFSKEIVTQHPGGVSAELMTVYSIVNTLAEIPPLDGKAVKSVQILINGSLMKNLVGHIAIDKPLVPEPRLISSI